MGMSTGASEAISGDRGVPRPRPRPSPAAVIWHDLECGGYGADLRLWRELANEVCPASAAGVGEALLDVGAGSGRVTLDLASHGHRVDALDRDGELLHALAARAEGLPVQTIRADARSFDLDGREYPLCIVPMQTVQLLDGADERTAFLRRARAHLRPGGLLACAIVTEIEPFDRAAGDRAPRPETCLVDGTRYVSRPVRVANDPDEIVIERERSIVPPGAGASPEAAREVDLVRLARVSVSQLEREGERAGLRRLPSRLVAETAEHAGSAVVMLRA